MWNRSSILLLVILLANPVLPRRASAGGGFQPSRGSSAARGAIGQPGGGYQPGGFQPGGVRPPTNQGGFGGGGVRPGGFPNQGGFHPQGGFSGGFRPGTGPGSAASSGTFKKALIGGALGAVGGLVAFEAGKAIIHSNSPMVHVLKRSHGLANGMLKCAVEPIVAQHQCRPIWVVLTMLVALVATSLAWSLGK
ncbi:unnamed protein product [Cylicostephanus goldi]|uniref:Uncharacterized protein n=1 Tax=Cylicostephanus goldi TaxID=71465 RepID=A0A3P7MK48_CYLGO|nr:unnamed protein product [Cylicostephanus goldi]